MLFLTFLLKISVLLPVPGLEGIAGPLEQVPLHHHTIRGIHVELHLRVVIREVLNNRRKTKTQDTEN